jgi:hypothetical protein
MQSATRLASPWTSFEIVVVLVGWFFIFPVLRMHKEARARMRFAHRKMDAPVRRARTPSLTPACF